MALVFHNGKEKSLEEVVLVKYGLDRSGIVKMCRMTMGLEFRSLS